MGRKTAEQLTEGIDASPLTIMVTGGTHGLGKETVRVLAKRGAHVYLAARNVEAASEVREEIMKETPTARIDLLKIDLASLDSVRTAASEFLALHVPLNVLVCNAGMASRTLEYSVDGVELIFATNYLGHVLLTHLLLDKIKETATESGIEGRIVNVSSDTYRQHVYEGGIRFDEIYRPDKTTVEGTAWSSFKSYGQSKLAQILYSKELAKRFQDEGVNNVTVNSLNPGLVRTNFPMPLPTWIMPVFRVAALIFGVSAAQGASLQTHLAISPDVEGVTGKYFDNGKEAELKHKYALDEELQKKLWDFSLKSISA